MLLASVHTALTGWDFCFAVIVLVGLIVLERLIPPVAWVLYGVCFMVALFGAALTINW